jgi:maltose alpha-D-glucosyltransferase / alpha-amylase
VKTQERTERYALPLSLAWDDATSAPFEAPLAIARVRRGPRVGYLTDGFASAKFARTILAGLARGADATPDAHGFVYAPAPALADIAPDATIDWLAAEQSNSTLVVGRQAVVKLFRRLVEGIHPETEMVRALTERGFTGIASLMGDVTYISPEGARFAVAVVQRFVENQGDGFQWLLDQVGRLIDDRAVTEDSDHPDFETLENFIEVIGRRLGEMHLVLAQPSDNPDFAPVIADAETVIAWRARVRHQLHAAFLAIENHAASKGEDTAARLKDVLSRRDAIIAAAEAGLENGEGSTLTRIHGDLHLGQVLVAGGDVVIIDFEGEPLKPLSERRAKNSPLRDVAGMARSFDYVAGIVARNDKLAVSGPGAERAAKLLQEFGEKARTAFLAGYGVGRDAPFEAREKKLLAIFALEKAAYEIVYEANNRPDWIDVPLAGFLRLADSLTGDAA